MNENNEFKEMQKIVSTLQSHMWLQFFSKMKNKKLEDLIDHYKKLIIYLQTSAYITAKFMTEKALGNKAPCIVSYSSILKFSGSKNGKVEKFPISKHNSYQVITDCIKNLLFGEHVSDFIVNINNHFTGLTADLFLFAHVTFPSFFLLFYFPRSINQLFKSSEIHDFSQATHCLSFYKLIL